jgi:hypothetical protein
MLRQAVTDFSLLLTRGYADKSALKLVGDHFQLNQRQRTAVMRGSCSDFDLARRQKHETTRDQLAGQTLHIDGYNILTTVEAALAGGILILSRDGCYRDMASMHGSFRKVQETIPAIHIMGKVLTDLNVLRCLWYFDSPVSNSGRLKTTILEICDEQNWNWQVKLVQNPDPILADADQIVATADSVILDRCQRWFNLAHTVLSTAITDAQIINIAAPPG